MASRSADPILDRRGRLALSFDPCAFAPGESYSVRVLFGKDGVRRGDTLYRKSFVCAAPKGSDMPQRHWRRCVWCYTRPT